MSRVQIYLNPEDIVEIDHLSHEINISRSQIIRDAIKKYLKMPKKKAMSLTEHPLMELSGIEISKTGKVGLNIDDIYLDD